VGVTPRVFAPRGGFADVRVAIRFHLGRPGAATVRVYNRAGRLVRAVAREAPLGSGENLLYWDGRDGEGRIVEDGLYVVSVEAMGETRTEAIAVVR
jgi:flagellar hook assembly protein FlgD